MRTGSPKKVRVLFVCIGNACRSQMAEAIARGIAHDIVEPSSAGLWPLGEVPELTRETLKRNGYSAECLFSKPIRREVWEGADIVINLSGEPKEIAFEDPGKAEDWDIADPYGADAAVYQRILVEIEGRVRELVERLREEREKKQGEG